MEEEEEEEEEEEDDVRALKLAPWCSRLLTPQQITKELEERLRKLELQAASAQK